ncbi:MAG TPA: hypothetical protein VMM12_03245 [Longimicrobiales bacterium]|nr:hypothetical protein [Longimicrobiales bacterium]
MRTTRITVCLIALALVHPASIRAQQSDARPGDGSAVAAEAGDDIEAARDRLHLLLLRPDVRRAARDRGIALDPIHEGIETLTPAALAQVAPYARAVESANAQSAITFSTTAIIIILLLVILLVLIT